MIHSKRIAAVAAVLLAASPTTLLADTLVENVNGLTLDAKGEVVRFTGLVIGKDGKIARLIRSNEMAGDLKKKKKNKKQQEHYTLTACFKTGFWIMPVM